MNLVKHLVFWTVSRQENNFAISVYRKTTFSGVGMSFFSLCYFPFKVNSIKTLLKCAYIVSSSYHFLHRKIEFLKVFFHKNGIPQKLIDFSIRK